MLLWAAHPPVDVAIVGPVALVPLLLLARGVGAGRPSVRAAFGWGFVAGLVLFALLLVWLRPFGFLPWLLLAGIQAAFVGVWVAAVAAFDRRPGRAVFAVAAWVALEGLRSVWPLGGFGWGLLGTSQHDGGLFLGAARTGSVLLVSALLAAVAVAIEGIAVRVVTAWRDPRDQARTVAVAEAGRTPAIGLLVVLMASVLLSGEPPARSSRTVDVAAVQADRVRETSAAGVNRLDTDRILRVVGQVLDATRPLAEDPPDVVIWPENALDGDYADPDSTGLRAAVHEALDLLEGSVLLAGGFTAGPQDGTVYNQLAEVRRQGFGAAYRKQRPVPFGEYVPWRSVIGGFPPLRAIPQDVIGGEGPQVLEVAGARVGPVICFENSYPGIAAAQVRAGAELLVVATNNSSFGESAMSRQHLALSQLRAVETGRWVVHAGLSGISAFIDPQGRLHDRTPLLERAIIRRDVPLVDGRPLAVVLGPSMGWIAAVVAAGSALVAAAVTRRQGGS